MRGGRLTFAWARMSFALSVSLRGARRAAMAAAWPPAAAQWAAVAEPCGAAAGVGCGVGAVGRKGGKGMRGGRLTSLSWARMSFALSVSVRGARRAAMAAAWPPWAARWAAVA